MTEFQHPPSVWKLMWMTRLWSWNKLYLDYFCVTLN